MAECNKGVTRQALIEKTNLPSGGDFSLKLEELIESGFVNEYSYYQNKKQLTTYRLTDEYSKFYLKFIQPNNKYGSGTWQRLSTSQSYKSWSGFSFETLCLKHISQIKKALGIQVIYSSHSSWFNENTQIDLLIDRDDNIINLCEMKFHNAPFTIDKAYYLNLKTKIAELKQATSTRKNVFLTMVTTFGVAQNEYSTELVQNTVEVEQLFVRL